MIEVERDGPVGWALFVQDHLIMMTPCHGIARRAARILEECRNVSHREAMRKLTEDIGCCDDHAQHVYSLLFHQPSASIN